MSKFIYIEDRDLETGHGWRDKPMDELQFKFTLGDIDGDLKVGIDRWVQSFAMCSYFWISSKEYYEENWHIEDNLRTSDLKEAHPKFRGHDTMESHFEFHGMNPTEARAHLESLGIMPGKKLAISAEATQNEGMTTIRIKYENGKPVVKQRVYFVTDPLVKPVKVFTTNEEGSFSCELSEGSYTLQVITFKQVTVDVKA